MSYCGECYYQGKKLKPCSTCYCGSEVKTECTNADHIRSMSDEELAEFLANFKNTFGEEYEGKMSCFDWLQSEAEQEG